MMTLNQPRNTLLLSFCLALAACDDAGDAPEVPEIEGEYTDQYGGKHTIDADAWTMGTDVFHVLSFDNERDRLVAQNDADNAFNPDLFSRFDWHVDGDDVYYCQSAFDAADEAAAEAATAADPTDLMTGCSGFPWTSLTP
ncbi:hypothetical protein [Nannocystis bainbridge]|uniref:Lipoprotein n=1 Tax=Nannocystis bainbridge TaxID=2995303 RepID=A0ABT5E813_9BACT|nr:hypothetical protein [Nannocystis bainbridge]MDC0720916.1 hypothetical protein [Nannocystis bainbridge]